MVEISKGRTRGDGDDDGEGRRRGGGRDNLVMRMALQSKRASKAF